MLKFEELILLDILRKKSIKQIKNLYDTFFNDYNKVIKLSIEQKILCNIYETLCEIDKKTKIKSTFYYLMIKNDLSERTELFLKIIKLLNDNKIEYVVIKGFVLGYLIYCNTTTRIFSDLDIIIKEKDYLNILDILIKNNYKILSYTELTKFIMDEYKIVLEYNKKKYTIEVKFSHRNINDSDILKHNNIKLNINNTNVITCSYEMNLISQIIYLDLYFNNPNSIINDNKMFIKFYLDLYNYIKKYYNTLNYVYTRKIINKLSLQTKILKLLKEIYIIFNDNQIIEFGKKIIGQNYFMKISNFESNIILKIFRNNEYKKFYIDYLLPYEILNKNLIFSNKYNFVVVNNLLSIIGTINYHNLLLKIIMDVENKDIIKDYLVIFKLYYKNEYNDFVYPYDCYTLRLNDFPNVYNFFTFEKDKYTGIYYSEREKTNIFGKNINTISGNKNKIEMCFNFSKEKWFYILNQSIGINIEFWEIIDDKIFLLDKISDDSKPLIFLNSGSTN